MDVAANINGKYVTSVTVGTGGQITIAYGNQATAIAGKVLQLTPYTSVNNDVSWQCGDHSMAGLPLTIATGAAAPVPTLARQAPPGQLPSLSIRRPG